MKTLEQLYDDEKTLANQYQDRALRAERRLKKCEALCEYARHREGCAWGPCTCGYEAASAALEGK